MATWNETVEQFRRVTDKLGKRIDDGIFETVVCLNMLGISTTSSCEGHLDWGTPYPWINIEPEIEQKYQLHRYLLQFYEERPIDFECILVWHGYKIRPQGAVFSPLLSSAEQERKLKMYQGEMAEFTAFLKSLLVE
ncbi:MAG TPA: hypothetical protein VFV38_43080 [Ktedonobacteraceae bacterium]|nr:hypothetical protein [Ktedonobacteraceae bacterium]